MTTLNATEARSKLYNLIDEATQTHHHRRFDESMTYQIVGDDEADVKSAKISVNSPIARGLIGKHIGDEAVIQTPAGEVVYEIDAVKHI